MTPDPFCVVIDPGHGGPADRERNLGVVAGNVKAGPEGFAVQGDLVEKDVTLAIAKALIQLLGSDPALRVRATRDRDVRATLRERAICSRNEGARLVVSVHVNANLSEGLNGVDVFHKHNSDVSAALAEAMVQTFPPELRRSSRKRVWDAYDDPGKDNDAWLQRPANVLDGHLCPAVLVECGYATNPVDRAYLLQPEMPARIACSIAGVIYQATRDLALRD